MSAPHSHIFEETRKAIDTWLGSVLSELTASQSIAVFGAGAYARYLAQQLKREGVRQVFFTVSVPRVTILDDTSVIALAELHHQQVDVILAGSLAEPEGQQLALRQAGIEQPFYALKGGAFLCSEPRHNPCDVEQLSALENAHRGQTFFAIGNGPSLNETPPEDIKSGIRLAGNGIVLRKNFIPDYYFLLEERALEHWQPQIQALTSPKIIASHLHFQHGSGSDRIYFPACFQSNSNSVDPYQFGIPSGGTIISTMLHFAVYMGAKQIVITGVDNNYCGDQKQTHFAPGYYTESRGRLEDEKAQQMALRQRKGILRAVKVAEINGIDVVDATPVQNNLGLKKVNFADFIK